MGAFFLSIEFQETGYLVYRALQSRVWKLTTPPGAPVLIVLSDFPRATQRIGQGVQVNVGNWQQQLEAKQSGIHAGVCSKARFWFSLPAGMSPSDFV